MMLPTEGLVARPTGGLESGGLVETETNFTNVPDFELHNGTWDFVFKKRDFIPDSVIPNLQPREINIGGKKFRIEGSRYDSSTKLYSVRVVVTENPIPAAVVVAALAVAGLALALFIFIELRPITQAVGDIGSTIAMNLVPLALLGLAYYFWIYKKGYHK